MYTRTHTQMEWQHQLRVGDRIDARDTDGRWFESIVVEVHQFTIKVHYKAWSTKYDRLESYLSDAIQPMYTMVPNWRPQLVPGDLIEIKGVPFPPTWYIGVIVNRDETGLLEVRYGYCKNKTVWVDVFSEEVACLGTHVRCEQNMTLSQSTVKIMAEAQTERWKQNSSTIVPIVQRNENDSCCICLNRLRNVVFLPCRHVCACYECSKNHTLLQSCPLCKSHIEQRFTVYL